MRPSGSVGERGEEGSDERRQESEATADKDQDRGKEICKGEI